MRQRLFGMFVGAGFGVIFVVANAHAPLATTVGTVLRVVAVLVLVSMIVLAFLAGRKPALDESEVASNTDGSAAEWYGFWFRLVVAGEVVLLLAGLTVRRVWGAPWETNIAWTALVVGLHLLVFRVVWKQRSIAVPGTLLTAFGAAGLIMAATPVVVWVPLVSGVLSGFTLLAGGFYGVVREYRTRIGGAVR